MNQIVQTVLAYLSLAIPNREILIFLVSILPITEARLAVPMAFSLKMPAFFAWFIPLLGSLALAPILLVCLLPFVRWLSNRKLFKKLGQTIFTKFEDKAKTFSDKDTEIKKFWAVLFFVAIPLPLTGVWTGCAIASILKMKFKTALTSVVCGNAIASAIMTTLCLFFSETIINYIITAIAFIALSIVFFLIFKAITHKSDTADEKI